MLDDQSKDRSPGTATVHRVTVEVAVRARGCDARDVETDAVAGHIATPDSQVVSIVLDFRTPRQLARRVSTVALGALMLGCRESEGSYQGYADRTSSVGDSALTAVLSYLTLDSTAAVRYDSAAASQLERLSTQFGGIMRPDTVSLWHRQMLEGLDSLVVAMRVLRERETNCARERTIDCVDARDFGHILGSMRTGARTYLDARRRMRETLATLGTTFPDPPAVSAELLTPRAARPGS